MSEALTWAERNTVHAPQFLRARVLALVSMKTLPTGSVPERLAAAGQRALTNVCKHPGDRTVALDLLAADALITMALQAQAEIDPAGLATFAEGLQRRTG